MTEGARSDQACESLRLFYREHADQARHYDTLRHASTGFAFAFAAGALAFVGSLDRQSDAILILFIALILVAVGLMSARLSELHWISNRKHVEIARAFRMSLQKALETPPNEEAAWESDGRTKRIMKSLSDQLRDPKMRASVLKDLKEATASRENGESESQKQLSDKELLDRCFQDNVCICDFRTIRDYGDARHQIEQLTQDNTPIARYIANLWTRANLVIVLLGAVLLAYACILGWPSIKS